ncbi:hypothetical protein LJC06_01840 [Bacteroidales bacterium OttesenSCG-928-I14]|nr:hypothetical protein [Bacteroidales bacterium OttesenSCG-928-I14]
MPAESSVGLSSVHARANICEPRTTASHRTLVAMLADSKKAKKMKIGILLGIVAGIIDVIPMILQNLTWDANLSAFTMWVIIGFLIAVIDLNINSIIKGILIAFLALLSSAILIGWQEPISLIPITVMTITLGGLLGFSIEKIMMNNNNKN